MYKVEPLPKRVIEDDLKEFWKDAAIAMLESGRGVDLDGVSRLVYEYFQLTKLGKGSMMANLDDIFNLSDKETK